MLMMSDLERIRGSAWPRIPLRMHLRACLPDWLGGAPVYRQVQEAGLFADQRDLLEYLFIQLLRCTARPGSMGQATDLVQMIRRLRWQMRCQGFTEGWMQFRPGVSELLKGEFERSGLGFYWEISEVLASGKLKNRP